jgi:pimeloyl-ACP methyl ester carboxylesterase
VDSRRCFAARAMAGRRAALIRGSGGCVISKGARIRAWKAEVTAREGGGRDYAAVCRVIAARIGARLVTFERSTHNPQLQEPQAFNHLLKELWRHPRSVALPTRLKGTRDRWHENAQHADREC